MASDFKRITLKNGLRILLMPYNSAYTASVGVWVGAGTRYENARNNGVSHFIEHMLFKGTKTRSALDIAESVDCLGANLNAFTTKQYTCFYAKTIDANFDEVSDILFDMVKNPLFAENDIESEKGVVCEEIGMYEDSPEDIMVDGMYAGIWSGSMLGANILGTRETVGGINGEMLRSYMQKRYTPGRIVIAAAGNFDAEKLVQKIESFFGCMPYDDGDLSCDEAKFNNNFLIFKRDFEQTNFSIGFKADKNASRNRYAISMLNSILGASSSSRLFQQIREKMGLAYSVGSSYAGYINEGFFAIDAGVNPASEKKAISEIKKIICDIKQNGITEREFERAKGQLKASVLMGLESSSSLAAHMGLSELLENRVRTEDEIISGFEAVTVDKINAVAASYFDFSNCAFSVVGRAVKDEAFYRELLCL